MSEEIKNSTEIIRAELEKLLSGMPLGFKVEAINYVRSVISKEFSPFKNEPIDFVQWVLSEKVEANDYNPNSVAPPEMELLTHSISHDGYTQPVVAWEKGNNEPFEVIDGFHRTRVAKEVIEVKERVFGYIPIASIKDDCKDRSDRIASTIRHNRARGKHKVDSMADIVIELKRRNWSDKKVGKELGMDEDEVLRLTQITGLAEMFADRDFSEAWQAELFEDEIIETEDEENLS